MPWNRKNYPKDWEEVRRRILERAGYKCERCGVPNYAYRKRGHDEWKKEQVEGVEGWSKIILMTAHICKCNPLCNIDMHLLVLCQLHHLVLDQEQHARNARATRLRKKYGNLEDVQFSLF